MLKNNKRKYMLCGFHFWTKRGAEESAPMKLIQRYEVLNGQIERPYRAVRPSNDGEAIVGSV